MALSIITMLCNRHHYLFQNFFITLNRNTVNINNSPFPPSLSPWWPLFYFLSLWICLLQIFHKNVITHYLFFCAWIISYSTMFSGFIHVVVCICIPFIVLWFWYLIFLMINYVKHLFMCLLPICVFFGEMCI